jgi:uncharacterized protein (UPF0261 family)
VLVSTFAFNGEKYAYVRDRLREVGVATILIDDGILGLPRVKPDISRDKVAQAAEVVMSTLVNSGDRGVR